MTTLKRRTKKKGKRGNSESKIERNAEKGSMKLSKCDKP